MERYDKDRSSGYNGNNYNNYNDHNNRQERYDEQYEQYDRNEAQAQGQYYSNEPITPADEVDFYLGNANSASYADEEEEQAAAEKQRLEKISDENTKSHSDALTVMIIAFVMLFFGTVFTALTDHQDFSDREGSTLKRIADGSFFTEIEANFNKSLPLQDYFHNASTAIRYCFGIGNDADFIDIEAKRLADDPYSVTSVDQYVAVPDQKSSDNGDDGGEREKRTLPAIETTSNNKNRKIKGITLTTLKSEDEMLADDYEPMALDRNPPPGNHDGGFNPYKDQSQPSETQPEQTQPAEQDTSTTTTTSKNYLIDPTRPGRTSSETEAPQPDVSDTDTDTGSDTLPPETEPAPPVTTKYSNPFINPVVPPVVQN